MEEEERKKKSKKKKHIVYFVDCCRTNHHIRQFIVLCVGYLDLGWMVNTYYIV